MFVTDDIKKLGLPKNIHKWNTQSEKKMFNNKSQPREIASPKIPLT